RLDPAHLGEVARDLGETDVLAILVAQRGDHHAGPETAAVAAQAPAFVAHATLAQRDLELLFGPAAVTHFLRIEQREVLADDLPGLVPLDLLGAGVPARDPAPGVAQEARGVAHGLHQPAEMPLVQLRVDVARNPARMLALWLAGSATCVHAPSCLQSLKHAGRGTVLHARCGTLAKDA